MNKKKQSMKLIKNQNNKFTVGKNKDSIIQEIITNLDGACYYHPFMEKSDIPDKRADYISKLTKIIDCEVHVKEAVEYVSERSGRLTDEVQVRYKIELNNRRDKTHLAEVDQEDITTPARFSSFLVSKGFIKFIGNRQHFNMFHEFLINEQKYPTIRSLSSWGEIKNGLFLFENGLYDVQEKKFFEADKELRIKYKNRHLVCPSGSEQVTPPRLSVVKDDTKDFLKETFLLWESFNGSLNVRTTIGYAVSCIFSKVVKEQYGAFPLLFKFGERGTGKSTSMDWFMALFGYRNGNRQSVSKQITLKSVIRRMSLPAYFPFFLDDYRNHASNSNAPDLTSPILNWYHRIGTGMAKKSTDNQTIDTPMKASVVMTGNNKPTDPAALSRLIILNYTGYLKKEEQAKIHLISDNTHRLSEFTHLILKNYQHLLGVYLNHIDENREWLANKGFSGRTTLIWGCVLAGNQCLPHILPGLTSWNSDFEGLRSQICNAITKEQSLQNEQAPLFTFFEALDHFSTMVKDPSDHTACVLDHRHFRIKEDEVVYDHNRQVIYEGKVMALHMPRIWNSLQAVGAQITRDHSKSTIDSMLMNSKYFLDKSQQVHLTKGLRKKQESNLRCYYLNIEELEKRGFLDGVINEAEDYEKNRDVRFS